VRVAATQLADCVLRRPIVVTSGGSSRPLSLLKCLLITILSVFFYTLLIVYRRSAAVLYCSDLVVTEAH